jgi:hypothetical protein
MKNLKLTIAIGFSLALTGCNGLNSYLATQTQTVEMYHIFDIKTAADTATITKATATGLSENTNDVRTATPLQLGKSIPSEPGRFVLKDLASAMGAGGAFMQMAKMQGNISMKIASCEDAVWNAKAVRSISGSNNLTLYACLFKYKAGYNLDIYAVFTKQEGGLYQISRTVASSLVGTPEEWVNKTVLDTVRSIEHAAGVKAMHVEGQPALDDLPAVDKLSRQ